MNRRADRFSAFDPMADGRVGPTGVAYPHRVANPAWADRRRADVLHAFDMAARWASQAALLNGTNEDALADLDDLELWAAIGDTILRPWGIGRVFDSELVIFDESPVHPPSGSSPEHCRYASLPIIDIRTIPTGSWYWTNPPSSPKGWAMTEWQSHVVAHFPVSRVAGEFGFLIESRPLTSDERELLDRLAIVHQTPGTRGELPTPEEVIERFSDTTRRSLKRLRRLCPTVLLPGRLTGIPSVQEFDAFFDALGGWVAAARNAVDDRRAIQATVNPTQPSAPVVAPPPTLAEHASRPFVPLVGWADILSALNEPHPQLVWKNDERTRGLIRNLNEEHRGPIKFEQGRGRQPKVDKAKLLAWWERLSTEFAAATEAGDPDAESAKLTASEGYDHGRTGRVAPGVNGQIKKTRRRQ